MLKKCNKCSVEKSLTEYSKCKSHPDGYSYKCKLCVKQYYLENQTKIKSYFKQYYSENKEYYTKKFSEYNPTYYLENKDKSRKYYRKYNPQYRKNNIERFRWRELLNNTLKRFNQSKSSSTYKSLGYTPQQLKEHLEKQGMVWGKHEIEHKIPLSWFKQATPFNIVNALDNLEPILPKDNKTKGNRFCSPTNSLYIKQIKPWIKDKYLYKIGI